MATSYFILKTGIAPPELRQQPEAVRLLFWGMVVDLGLKRKDWELARGLNAKGEPLPGVAAATRKHRKSEMTPSGKGDPRAPYLMPGRGLSRTRSLLAGKPHADYAEFFWRYDAWTGDQWGKILAHHARRGTSYNVVGLSPKGIAWVAAQAAKRWRDYQAGRYVEPIPQPRSAAASLPFETPGRTNLDFATFGIGGDEASARRAIAEGRSSGFMGRAEWEAYFRSRRPAVRPRMGQAPSVSRGASNVLLQSIWNVPMQTREQLIETGINTLLSVLDAGLGVPQLESLLGDLFADVIAEAVRRGLIVITRGADGAPRLRVVR